MERTRVWAERWNRATLPPPPPRGLKKVEVYSSPTLSPEVGNSELRGQVCHPQQALLPLLAPRLRLFLSLCWWEEGAKKAGSGSWTLHLRSCPELGQGHPWLAAGEAGRCWEMCKNVQQIYSYGGWSKWGWDPPPRRQQTATVSRRARVNRWVPEAPPLPVSFGGPPGAPLPCSDQGNAHLAPPLVQGARSTQKKGRVSWRRMQQAWYIHHRGVAIISSQDFRVLVQVTKQISVICYYVIIIYILNSIYTVTRIPS